MSADARPAWVGLFPDQAFEFRFGARAGDAGAFFADTTENATLMEGRRVTIWHSARECVAG